MKLRAGDWVEVRSKAEILSTLDEKACLEGLPFMPEMFRYCGQRLQVYKRAHKTCDTVNWTGNRRLVGGIHLPLRCDGEAHGGCQAACLLFWKAAWLKPVNERQNAERRPFSGKRERVSDLSDRLGGSDEDVYNATRADHEPGGEPKYVCQATQLPYFTEPLRWWDVRQYVEDLIAKNVSVKRMFCNFVYAWYYEFARRGKLGAPFRWFYDRFQAVLGGVPFPRRKGMAAAGTTTPTSVLDLQPGELVRVKSYDAILRTLDTNSKNRGLAFDAELVPYCGGSYRVRSRVSHFIDEKTGKMSSLRTPAVILENVYCQSRYSGCRVGCPRSIYSWWREIWLDRVPTEE
jgi:hypothetical protein